MTPTTKERPIIMQAVSINGILAGRKTQTRRIVKPQPDSEFDNDPPVYWPQMQLWHHPIATPNSVEDGESQSWRCPYGKPGDQLWVRERWCAQMDQQTLHEIEGKYWYEATDDPVMLVDGDGFQKLTKAGMERSAYRSSLFMPRVACRLVLEVVSVRVERVQDIDKAGVIAEGVTEREGCPIADVHAGWHEPFADLWNDTNGKGAWERNDWCWAVTFKVVKDD